MNKLELIKNLKQECQLSIKEAAAVVDLFFGKISDALVKGGRVEIRGLCTLYVKEYDTFIV